MEEALISAAKSQIPSADAIREELIQRAVEMPPTLEAALLWMDAEGLQIFEAYQTRALQTLVERWIDQKAPHLRSVYEQSLREGGWEMLRKAFISHLAELAKLVQKLEKDLGNMRKARGGSGFQKNLLYLLHREGIPAEIPTGQASRELGRIDLVIPSVELALSQPDRAFFLTCKRTLRERWKQEVPHGQANRRFYLVTLDESLSESKAREIKEMGLIAFVRQNIVRILPPMQWIRPIDDLPKNLR